METSIQFPQIVTKIIKEQELIIGPLAWDEARKVSGLQIIDSKNGEVKFDGGDPKTTIDKLVAQYDRLFGRASHEVSKEAALPFLMKLSPEEIPSSLK